MSSFWCWIEHSISFSCLFLPSTAGQFLGLSAISMTSGPALWTCYLCSHTGPSICSLIFCCWHLNHVEEEIPHFEVSIWTHLCNLSSWYCITLTLLKKIGQLFCKISFNFCPLNASSSLNSGNAFLVRILQKRCCMLFNAS